MNEAGVESIAQMYAGVAQLTEKWGGKTESLSTFSIIRKKWRGKSIPFTILSLKSGKSIAPSTPCPPYGSAGPGIA